MRVPGHQRKSYTWRWTAALAGLAVLSFALVMAVVVRPAERVQAVAYSVTTTVDGVAPAYLCPADATHPCSLRQAITNANVGGHNDTIGFSIPAADPGCSGGVCTIALGSSLPAINDIGPPVSTLAITGPVGYSVVIDGSAAGGDCFSITSNGNTIRNLVINNCNAGGDGIEINNANGNTVAGNRIGTDATGILNRGNTGAGVHIAGTSANNTIGGAAAGDRNIISANTGAGINIDVAGTAHTTTIRGNYIGTTAAGDVVLGNTGGGIIAGGNGSNTILGNVIGGNTGAGINLNSTQNIVRGNSIGVNGTTILPNTADGIDNTSGINNIGGTAAGDGNVIAHNGGANSGVNVVAGSAGIRRNSMFLNAGPGIVNVAPPAFPVINPATYSGGVFHVSGTAPASSTVEVFLADPDGQEGQTYVASYVTNGLGNWGGDLCVNGAVAIVATATDTTTPDTSAFSLKQDLPAGTCAGAATATAVAATATAAVATATTAPTSTPAGSATPTRTATPVPGAATATPTTGPMESVTLAGNTCNPVASTYPDDTPIATIAGAVSPSANLISIWWLDAANGRWLGYSPQFVAESDLTAVDRLEAIFICVSSASTWSRPLI